MIDVHRHGEFDARDVDVEFSPFEISDELSCFSSVGRTGGPGR
jgi:hypothetical protein